MRATLPVEKRVAIALWKLATPDCYRLVANQFGVGKSTVGLSNMRDIVERIQAHLKALREEREKLLGFKVIGEGKSLEYLVGEGEVPAARGDFS
ncbi:uncharacterized protein LOC142069261 isoform X2 [Caretta caretta]|uniref:uncharacterized protein LOC142069261 isoform X2 n=1 Tax=Caretta caretta TaxID=8467 RepID=UPI003F4BE788